METSRRVRLGWAVGLALSMVLASAVVSHAAVSLKKPYTIDIQPYDLVTGSVDATMTITITNKTTTQNLGSCDISQGAFVLKNTSQPSGGGTANITGNVLHLRGLATLPMASRSVQVVVDAPTTDGLYTWSVDCRQANNFSPDKQSNQFTLDGPNSHRVTNVYTPLPVVDVAVIHNADSTDPVVGSNTVEYTVRVRNNSGSLSSGALTLTDSLPSGGAITSIATTGWSCPGTLPATSTQCTHSAIGPGTNAQDVVVRVLAPNSDTTIVNRANVTQAATNDPNTANNTLDQSTTVNKDSSCASGYIGCATGRVIYDLDSQVKMGNAPDLQHFVTAVQTFLATTTSGSQNWSMSAPAIPGAFCPINFTPGAPVTQCTWQVNADPYPFAYPNPGKLIFEATCYRTRCPQGVVPGAGTLVVILHDDNSHEILPGCNGPSDSNRCFEQLRTPVGDLKIRVRNMVAGDPRIAGYCVGGGC
jgi:uncharacterized repeat protein (TIGR01451 family)